jgi:hypothetical protein
VLDQLRRPVSLAVIVACAAFVLAGCMSGQSATSAGGTKTTRINLAPLSEYEATLNPADYDQEVEVIQKQQSDEHPTLPIDVPLDTAAAAEQVLQGFRIQIFSSASIDEANAAKFAAIERFVADSVYVLFDAPVYKVRVGDFVNRYEASQRLTEFNEMGYRDAWVVPDRIVRRSPARTLEKPRDDR